MEALVSLLTARVPVRAVARFKPESVRLKRPSVECSSVIDTLIGDSSFHLLSFLRVLSVKKQGLERVHP